ncbi:MAG: anhydro-N-acetylmuramic acid kinase [Alphaproteobacteria bacterium]|nr:anhydro-N-acetylmuramic acid kinase [Alphaproteobacteria bacterium]
MDEQKVYRAIGLMSGTSLDGAIDVALIETDGEGYVKPLGFYAHPYGAEVRDSVRACFGKRVADNDTRAAEDLVTQAHIEAVKASGFEAGVIGFHGQTITHDPDAGLTWQLGDADALAQACGIDVVADMRQADVKAGGQGAPLAPLYHDAIVQASDAPVAVLNIGGVSNVTFIGQELVAFDAGPGNAIMDDYCKAHFDCEFDEDGKIAHSGKADRAIVDAFLDRGYFKTLIPKSLDRNEFADLAAQLPEDPKDALATLAVCSAAAVMAAVKHFPRVPEVWYVCGGGRKNNFMMELLRDMLAPSVVKPIEDLGYDGDAIEAQAFAYLAVRSLLGLPLTVPGTTGVPKALTGGTYYNAF